MKFLLLAKKFHTFDHDRTKFIIFLLFIDFILQYRSKLRYFSKEKEENKKSTDKVKHLKFKSCNDRFKDLRETAWSAEHGSDM